MTPANKIIDAENFYGAHNYASLPVVLTRGLGVHLWDIAGNQYLDMMSAYSAVSHGHCHPKLVNALCEQAQQLAVISRAYHSDKLADFLQTLCQLTGYEKALPMNSGAEAVETAIKAARKWAYTVKGIAENQAEIIVCRNNFHGRTTTITGFSSVTQYRQGFGPFTPGFKLIPFADSEALTQMITANTAAFLVEPIQGEGGIHVPPPGYLKRCADICKKHNVLLLCDEIQTGLGRTGKLLASDHDNVKPDGLILGKALGGGLLPVSAFLTSTQVMDVFTPGDHGSTFGGNPLAAVVAKKALELLTEEKLIENSATLGAYFIEELRKIKSAKIANIRGKGLFVGIELNPDLADAHAVVLTLLKLGLLSKETRKTVIRLAPPLVINRKQIDQAVSIIREALD